MEYRDFGQTGIKVSAIGFGGMGIGGTYGDISYQQAEAAINRALDLGVTCFDNAAGYARGESERFLGRALGSRRKDVIVVTKVSSSRDPDRFKGRDQRRSYVMASCEESLQRLGTDYLDVLMIHWPDVTTAFEETMTAYDDLVKQGKVRFVGESNMTVGMIKECMKTRRMDVVQGGLNMFDRRLADRFGVFPFCEEQNIGVMTYASLARGMLAGVFTEDTEFGPGDSRAAPAPTAPPTIGNWDLRLFAPEQYRRNVRVVEELKPIAARLGKKMPHLALRWVLSNPAVSTALVGMMEPQEVEDNMGALDWTLSAQDMADIEAVFARHDVDTAPNIWVESVWDEDN